MTHGDYLRRAIALAEENALLARGGPFGALIVRDGAVIATGVNVVTSTGDPTAHAEIMAIREACRRVRSHWLRGCRIYSSCEPCPMCLGAIHWARLDGLWFAATREDAASAGFDDSFIYDQVALAPEDRTIPGRRQLTRAGRKPLTGSRAEVY